MSSLETNGFADGTDGSKFPATLSLEPKVPETLSLNSSLKVLKFNKLSDDIRDEGSIDSRILNFQRIFLYL